MSMHWPSTRTYGIAVAAISFSLTVWLFSYRSTGAQRDTEGGLEVQFFDHDHPCGPTCVSLMSRILGHPLSLDEAYDLVSPDGLGRSSVAQLDGSFRKLGLSVATMNLPASDLYKLSVPAVLFWQGSHFVVAINNKDGKTMILDPPRDPTVYSTTAIAQSYSGVAILAHNSEQEITKCLSRIGIQPSQEAIDDSCACAP